MILLSRIRRALGKEEAFGQRIEEDGTRTVTDYELNMNVKINEIEQRLNLIRDDVKWIGVKVKAAEEERKEAAKAMDDLRRAVQQVSDDIKKARRL